jgi:hypothetical protein
MRNGNFSSSQIHKLVKSGRGKDDAFSAPGLTYIQEKKYEMRLGRSITSETNAKPTSWGNLLELYVWEYKIGLNDYRLESKKRYSHPTVSNWNGCPDLVSEVNVADIKCPYTLKAFCGLVDCMDDSEKLKESSPDYYWQLVSNAILTEKNIAELIVFVPYKEDLDDIRAFLDTDVFSRNGLDQNKFSWLNWATDEDLPYLINGNEYVDLNVMTFDIPQSDKDFLTERVELAVKLLNEK